MTHVVTFGCRLNTYESSVIKDLTIQAGLDDVIVINTCSVTSEAERQARQSIRKLKRNHPNCSIIVTGCAAQIRPEMFEAMPEVSHVLGNHEKMNLESYQKIKEETLPRVVVNDIFSITETASHLTSGFEGRVRAFVQVQNGCNHRCTFCTIPYGRGNSRSVPLSDIVAQVNGLLEKGYIEFVLTGVDLTAYGEDLPGKPSLAEMIKRLLVLLPDLKRLRLSSLDPVEVDDVFWDLIAHEERLMPHLHLSLQAGDDLILKRMKRRHLRQDAIDFCKKARDLRPDVVFGADIIVGFPTETLERFQNTLNIVDECDLTFLHTFPFSPRPNTPASRMPQVSHQDIKERSKIFALKSQEALKRTLESFQGKVVTVLMETDTKGKTDHFLSIHHISTEGFLVQTRVQGQREGILLGQTLPL